MMLKICRDLKLRRVDVLKGLGIAIAAGLIAYILLMSLIIILEGFIG